MIDFFYYLNSYEQTLFASILTFLMTVLGAGLVFFFKNINKRIMEIMISLSAGIMLSAAIFSLLLPAIDQANYLKLNTTITVVLGILLGSTFLILGDKIANKFYLNENKDKHGNIFLLVSSILIHNIPEGMAIGVAFGSILYNIDGVSLATAISITFGIGIQNLPEGAAISIPLRNAGYSRKKAFLVGALTGIVEPFSAILGVFMVLKIKLILPYLLAFAAGAMIFVVIEELIPEALNSTKKTLMAYICLIGFILMMILELGI